MVCGDTDYSSTPPVVKVASPLHAAGTAVRVSTADQIVAGIALFIIANGVVTCIGWWSHTPLLVQLFPDDAPTHFNTALGFILLGIAELSALMRHRILLSLMAWSVICLATLELTQYVFGYQGGVDTLFVMPFMDLDSSYPGRMSGNTVACFLLLGGARLLTSRPDANAGPRTTLAVAAQSLAGGIAFVALLGYVVGLKSAYGWSTSVGMSVRSWAGFLLLFSASIGSLWQRDIVAKPGLPDWFLPFLGITTGTIGVGLFWIRSSPIVRPFMLDPQYAMSAHRMNLAIALSIGILVTLGTLSIVVARHKAKTARVNEKKLISVLDLMSDGVMLLDAMGNSNYRSPAWASIHGLNPSEAALLPKDGLPVNWQAWDEQGCPLDPAAWPLSKVDRGEIVKNQVLRVRQPATNHEFIANYNGSPIYDDDGKIALSFITAQDITERKIGELQAQEREDRLRTLADAIPQLAWMARADGFVLWYNQRWHDYTGTTPAQMEGWGWQHVHDPAMLTSVLIQWREAIELGQPFEMQFPLRAADGTFRDFLNRGQPMKDSEGRVTQWFGTCTDVNQLKQIERSLRMTQMRLESTLEVGSVGTWTWDIASDQLMGDEVTARMFSIPIAAAAEGLPAAAYLQVVHEDDRPIVAAALERAIERCTTYDVEYRVQQPSNECRWVQARGRVESDGAGHATYFHGAVIDITERKLAELSLRDNNLQLARSNRDLEDFAYIASHDLKTPLSGIKSAALWLAEDLPDLSDESRTILALMQSRIGRMETLLEDLLTYSRVGRSEPLTTETNLEEMFSNILEVLDPPPHISVRLEGELPGMVVTASAQLEQVLRNLINNAIKHHDKAEGEVILSGKQVGIGIEFTVRDDGPGIPPQFHRKIFQLFQTLKRRDEVEGSGMGLALVKKLIEQQNSCISVHSAGDGTGAEFRFEWPTTPVRIPPRKAAVNA